MSGLVNVKFHYITHEGGSTLLRMCI